MLLFCKSIDKSVFQAGFAIPVEYKEDLFREIGFSLKRGESRHIKLLIDNDFYQATISSINFDRTKYPNHNDMLQVRYSSNSSIAIKFQQIFSYTKKLIEDNFDKYNAKWLASFPEYKKEYMAIYSTSEKSVLKLDCITNGDFEEESKELVSLGETLVEQIFNSEDPTSKICLKTKVCKIRHLSKTIGEDLKKIYGYRCQICGVKIGEQYGSNIIHAHHIDYFVNSLNNNAENIMIVCPNHHAIIHDKNPVFDRETKTFIYSNGYKEQLKLNVHLK